MFLENMKNYILQKQNKVEYFLLFILSEVIWFKHQKLIVYSLDIKQVGIRNKKEDSIIQTLVLIFTSCTKRRDKLAF